MGIPSLFITFYTVHNIPRWLIFERYCLAFYLEHQLSSQIRGLQKPFELSARTVPSDMSPTAFFSICSSVPHIILFCHSTINNIDTRSLNNS
jgi:hypothetical protein